MTTDWVLIRRLAHEIDQRLRGARAGDAGRLGDGRAAVALHSRAGNVVLAIDAFASPPIVTLESSELGIAPEPGFLRSVATALRGMTLTEVRARRGDRLLRLVFSSRSRFGVGDQLELYLELVPRFGNLVLVKGGTVVAAAKEFSLAENGSRAVSAGLSYAMPPLPPQMSLVPKVVAESGTDPQAFLTFADGDEAMREPLYVYRRGESLLQAHVVPLDLGAGVACLREDSILEVFAQVRRERIGRGERERAERRRDALLKRLLERERKLNDELASLAAKRRRALERTALRSEGEAIYASLHELPEPLRDEAKERAASLFAQYKKLGAAIPHVDRRARAVRASLEAVESLRWECERIADDHLDDLETAVAQLDPRQNAPRPAARSRKRAPLEFRTTAGSRIVVGRSPLENADVTFRVARPNDLWFHAQGIPGAHVILARDDRSEAPDEDVEAAAALAAFHSRAKGSAKVPVDYTARKHVRKQQNAAPGLVWYTDFKTATVEPRDSITPEPAS